MDDGYAVFVHTSRNPRQVVSWLNGQLWFWDAFSPNDQFLRFGYKAEQVPFWKRFWDKPRVLGVTNRKLPAVAYIDDRAIHFEGDWSAVGTDLVNLIVRNK